MAVADQGKPGPIKRVVRRGLFEQGQRSLAQRFGLACFAGLQAAMKLQHQIARAGRFDFPLTHDGRRHTGNEQGPRQSDHAFACTEFAARGFTRRQHSQLRLQLHLHQLPHFQQAVFGFVFLREDELRIERGGVIQNAVRGEVQNASLWAFGFDAFFAGFGTDIHFAPCRAV